MSDDIVTRLTTLAVEGKAIMDEQAAEIERLRKQRDELAWAIAWFLNGGSRERLEQRLKEYEATL